MSKQGKRKITVELPKAKDLANRPSVFERLGTKKNSSAKKTVEHCRQWAQNGSCAYGKSCKFASTHTLISPSKQRAANKDSEQKRLNDDIKRLHSTVVVRSGRGSPDGELENWDQNDLEYADTDVLEKRRQQLQRELELQLKMDGKDMRKDKKKAVTSSSSSRSSSSSSVSSSSSDGSSSSSSSGRDVKRKGKKGKLKRNSSSSSEDIPPKRKFVKSDLTKKVDQKKIGIKRDEKLIKKQENTKKKTVTKVALGKKSLSPGKKSGGTPPITSKNITKNVKHTKSPSKRERNKSASPHLSRDKDRERNKEREKEKERERPRGRSRSPKKNRSRSPRRHGSHSKDIKRKASSERSRPVSPKKQPRKEISPDRHRKLSVSRDRDRARDHKDRSLERRKDKHDDKERHDRKDRGRNKDNKRDDKRRGRDRGLGRGAADKGLEKPSKPMERLLPRPEERLAALAAISNRVLETDKNSTNSKDNHSERGGRKPDRERDRSTSKRDRMGSTDRDQGPREDDRSPGYRMSSRDRHYDAGYEISGPSRGYPDDDDRMYGEHIGSRGDHGYDDRRPHRERSWEGRSGSIDRERGYMHPHKEWDNEDYDGEWRRERHWSMHDPQMGEWGDKEQGGMDGWHQRGGPGASHRGRMNENYRGRMDGGRNDAKRRGPRPEAEPPAKTSSPQPTPAAASAQQDAELDEKPIRDDLSEISDDPDDILNREDMAEPAIDDESQSEHPTEDAAAKPDNSEKESTQDTSGAADDKESQDAKDDEDVTNMDFEEISDGELEEERTRAGLGDALGVDWASLVADVRRREHAGGAGGGARARWRPERLLPRLGISLHMAGAQLLHHILRPAADQPRENGDAQRTDPPPDDSPPDLDSIHPIAAMQVALQKRKKQRAVLFGSGCEITRGLSARRDLALRRYLCNLPPVERSGQSRASPQPVLFHAARALLMQAPASG